MPACLRELCRVERAVQRSQLQRERERHTDRERDKQRQTERDRHRQIYRQRHNQTYILRQIETKATEDRDRMTETDR